MQSMNYTTLIFDAFDTVIHINTSKLPVLHIDGKEILRRRTQSMRSIRGFLAKPDFDAFYHGFSQSFRKLLLSAVWISEKS